MRDLKQCNRCLALKPFSEFSRNRASFDGYIHQCKACCKEKVLKVRDRPIDFESVRNRFFQKVQKTDSCWLWTAERSRGYGRFRLNGRTAKAHRVSYELTGRSIPEGMTIDHLCRNPSCVNPDHLEPVSNKENILRGTGFTAANKRKTHCMHGHEFTDTNTIWTKDGRRKCSACTERWARQRNRKPKDDAHAS